MRTCLVLLTLLLLAGCDALTSQGCADMCKPHGVLLFHSNTNTCLCQPAQPGQSNPSPAPKQTANGSN